MSGVPSASWFAHMRALDRANATLKAQNDAFDAGERWRITIAPHMRPSGNIAVVAHCICGYQSSQVIADDAAEVAWGWALEHLRAAHNGGLQR